MKYYNEATAEIVSSTEERDGVIPIEKKILSSIKCKIDPISGDSLTIFNEDLTKNYKVTLQYDGDTRFLAENGYPDPVELIREPCYREPDIDALKVSWCDDVSMSKVKLKTGTERKPIGRSYLDSSSTFMAYSVSFVVYTGERYNLFESQNIVVFVDRGKLYINDTELMDVRLGEKTIFTILRYPYYNTYGAYSTRNHIASIILVDKFALALHLDGSQNYKDAFVNTGEDGFEVYDSNVYRIDREVDGHGVTPYYLRRYAYTAEGVYQDTLISQHFSSMLQAKRAPCKILKEMRGECK